MTFTEQNFLERFNALSLDGKNNFYEVLNVPHVHDLLRLHAKELFVTTPPASPGNITTPKKSKKSKKKEYPPSPTDSANETETPAEATTLRDSPGTIDFLLTPANCKKDKGEKSKATDLLHSLDIKKSWTPSNFYQIKHCMDKGSIKLVGSRTSLGEDNQLEGKKLDPYDHESVKTYLEVVKTIPNHVTQGRGYLRTSLVTLDMLHNSGGAFKLPPPFISKSICFGGDDTMASMHAFVKNLTTSEPGKLQMTMNGVVDTLDHSWLEDEFFAVCDECVDAGWDVEVHYEAETDHYRLVVGMYKNKIRSDEMEINANDCKEYTEDEQEAEADAFIRGLDDSLTAEEKARLRQSCLATLYHCTTILAPF